MRSILLAIAVGAIGVLLGIVFWHFNPPVGNCPAKDWECVQQYEATHPPAAPQSRAATSFPLGAGGH